MKIKKFAHLLLPLFICISSTIAGMAPGPAAVSGANPTQDFTFAQWIDDLMELPFSRQKHLWHKNKPYEHKAPRLTIKSFTQVISAFTAITKQQLSNPDSWLNHITPKPNFYDIYKKGVAFMTNPFKNEETYAQRLVVPAGSEIAFHGDLHGDAITLAYYLDILQKRGYLDEQGKIIRENFYMIFLGDYTDRGKYGAEVLYTILRLKIANPDRVILVRGNHESGHVNASLGFHEELDAKFDRKLAAGLKTLTAGLYTLMPPVLYLGTQSDDGTTNYIQCNHGGLEFGYIPHMLLDAPVEVQYELIQSLDRSKAINLLQTHLHELLHEYENYVKTPIHSIHQTNITPLGLGFLWHDFIVHQNQRIDYNEHRGFAFGRQLTLAYLEIMSSQQSRIRAIFRAHQHQPNLTPMMRLFLTEEPAHENLKGIAALWHSMPGHEGKTIWDGMVATFLVSPDTVYGEKHRAEKENADNKTDDNETDEDDEYVVQEDYPGFNYNAFGMLTTAPHFDDWRLQSIIINHEALETI